MSDTIDLIEDAQDCITETILLLEDLGEYLSLDRDSDEKGSDEKIFSDIKGMIDVIIHAVDVVGDKVDVIHQHLGKIAEEVSEEG